MAKVSKFSDSSEVDKHHAQPATIAHAGSEYFYPKTEAIAAPAKVGCAASLTVSGGSIVRLAGLSRATSAGSDAGKPIILGEDGLIHVSFIPDLSGLYYAYGSKVSDSDLWDGYEFADYLNQAVKSSSIPTFAGLTSTGLIMRYANSGWPGVDCRLASDTASEFPLFRVDRCRNTYSSPSAVQLDDWLGGYYAYGYYNADWREAFALRIRAGTPGGSYVPGNVLFYTTNSSGTSGVRMRITADGLVNIGASTPNEALTVESIISLKETTAPSLSSGYGKIYVKSSDSLLYFMSDAGTEYSLTSVAHAVLSATHSDTLADSVIAGDILYGNSTPKWARLAKGNNGEFLSLVSGYPAWGVKAPILLGVETTELDVTNTTTETDFYTYAFSAGQLGASDAIRVTLRGRILNNTGGGRGVNIKVYIGSTCMYADKTVSFTSQAAYHPFSIDLIFFNKDSQSSQMMIGTISIGAGTNATTGLGNLATIDTLVEADIEGTATENMSGALTFKVAVKWDEALSGLHMYRDFGMIEKLLST